MVDPENSSPGRVVAFLVGGGMGAYVIFMARKFYARPDQYIERWQRWLPQKGWAWRMVRYWACFCIWAGLLMIIGAVFVQVASVPAGFATLAVVCGIAVVATWILLPRDSLTIRALDRNRRPR